MSAPFSRTYSRTAGLARDLFPACPAHLSPCNERFIRKDSSKYPLAFLRSPVCRLKSPRAYSVAAMSGWSLSPSRERFIRKD
jgi:hypothetical protein